MFAKGFLVILMIASVTYEVSAVVDGGYSDWSTYTTCTLTCGGGTQSRSRTCTNPVPENGGADCTLLGETSETEKCNTAECSAIDGGNSEWSTYTTCTLTCGGGTQSRSRTCTNPAPENGGIGCILLVDGGYSEWSKYTTCTVKCGGGTQSRSRTCTNPVPENGGAHCTLLGEASETQACSTAACSASVVSANLTEVSAFCGFLDNTPRVVAYFAQITECKCTGCLSTESPPGRR